MKTRKRKTMFIFLIVFVIFNLASSVFALELDKTQYQLGDVVKITIDSGFVDEGYSLEIASKESVYRYLELIELDIIFIPRYIGEYDLRIVDRLNDQVIVSRSFEVIDPSIKEPGLTDMGEKETKKIIDEINSKVEQTVTISIRDGKNNIRQKSAILRKKDSIPKNNIQSDFNIFRVNSLTQETNKASTPDSNSVEFIPGTNGPVKKIIFNDLDVENNLELGLDEIDDSIKKKEDKDFKKLYAIDPSKLDFSEANVTSVAEGKELYKCKDWNFSEQKCYGSWVKIMDLVPGQEYTFTLTPADPGFGESSPPEPHNVQGRVFNSDGVTGVDNGVPVLLNNTDNENLVLTEVYAPPIPSLKGAYSASINGSDNDNVTVMAWNSTSYGINSSLLQSSTTNLNIVIDLIRTSETNVTITIPLNNSMMYSGQIFNVTANIEIIGGQSGTNCFASINISNEYMAELYQDNYEHSLGDINLGESKTTTWNLTAAGYGLTNITVNSYCDSDGVNIDNLNSYTVYDILINDSLSPNVTLISPDNNTWNSSTNLSLHYNTTDSSDIRNCSLYFNGILNITDDNVASGSLNYFLLNNTVDGNHSWFVSCYDNSTNFNQGNSTIWQINVDKSFPIINLISPKNNTNVSNNTVIFEYNVTDSYGEISNCSLVLNDNLYSTNYNITLNATQNFTFNLSAGLYNWSIMCVDKANNTNHSIDWTINITDSDLAIYDSDINFSTNNPVENQAVMVNATIRNIGNENATNVIVRFFENEPYLSQIGSDIIINLSIGESITVNTSWNSKVGTYYIYVVVDPPYETNGSISEFNESNNVANKTLFTPAYNIYYGKTKTSLLLNSGSNSSVFDWFSETNINGNIYVVDADSSISWTSLRALSINITNETSNYDFLEADNALDIGGLSDSLENTYTKSGTIRNINSFVVYNNNITNVPIVNSTNASNFVTGILWDFDDLNPGEYNGSQDLVFITNVNQNNTGRYGSYDYEIKVPANLRKYIVPNIEDHVTFYAELD